jgi:hypothetical protein
MGIAAAVEHAANHPGAVVAASQGAAQLGDRVPGAGDRNQPKAARFRPPRATAGLSRAGRGPSAGRGSSLRRVSAGGLYQPAEPGQSSAAAGREPHPRTTAGAGHTPALG